MQLHGEYLHRIDPQGRIAIPARYREAFRGGIYLTKGFDPCVWAFSASEWEAHAAGYAAMSPNSRIGRILRRRVFGSTFDLELDRQGRVLLPQPLRQYASLQDEVIIVGAGPVGLVTAMLLAERQIPVVILEADGGINEDLRASTFHPPTLDMLAPFGVTGQLIKQGLICPTWQIVHPP